MWIHWIAPTSKEICVLMFLLSAPCFPQILIKHRQGRVLNLTPIGWDSPWTTLDTRSWEEVWDTPPFRGEGVSRVTRWAGASSSGCWTFPLGGRSQRPTFRWLKFSGTKHRSSHCSRIPGGDSLLFFKIRVANLYLFVIYLQLQRVWGNFAAEKKKKVAFLSDRYHVEAISVPKTGVWGKSEIIQNANRLLWNLDGSTFSVENPDCNWLICSVGTVSWS